LNSNPVSALQVFSEVEDQFGEKWMTQFKLGGVLNNSLTLKEVNENPAVTIIKSELECVLEKLKKLVRLTLSFASKVQKRANEIQKAYDHKRVTQKQVLLL
jgi:hypothetical protein